MYSQATSLSLQAEDEIQLRDYWRVLVRRRRLILYIICAMTLLTVILALRLHDIYRGKAVIIPLSKSTSGVQSVLGELGSFLPLGMGMSESSSTRLLAILSSRTLAEDVIQHLNLLPLLYADQWDTNTQQWTTDNPPTMQSAVQRLLQSEWDEKKGIITVTADHPDPVLAAAIVNQCIDALQRALNENAFTLSKKNRVFIEEQLQKTNQALEVAEEAARQFEQTYGIVALDAQAQAAVNALAGLEAQIMAREVQLGVLQWSLTAASREVSLVQEELQGLRTQLARLQQGTPGPFSPAPGSGQNSQMFLSLDKAPDIKLQYARLQRELLIQNRLFALLTQQYEQSKIDEVRDQTAFQVLDRAIPPERKAKPSRVLIVMLAMVAGAFLGALVAFVRDALDTRIHDREQVESQTGISVLVTIPSPVRRRGRRWQQRRPPQVLLTGALPANSPCGEAFRYLYARLKHQENDHGPRMLLFTSPGPAEETTTTLINLALVVASLGERTLLVDSNLHQPVLHSLLRCPLTPGLLDILALPEEWQKGVHCTPLDNLHLIPAGTASAQPSVAIESSVFEVLLTHFRANYAWIFFAAPPVLSATDAAMLSTKVDTTCLVLTCEVSRLEAVREAKAALEAVQGKVMGAVLTGLRI